MILVCRKRATYVYVLQKLSISSSFIRASSFIRSVCRRQKVFKMIIRSPLNTKLSTYLSFSVARMVLYLLLRRLSRQSFTRRVPTNGSSTWTDMQGWQHPDSTQTQGSWRKRLQTKQFPLQLDDPGIFSYSWQLPRPHLESYSKNSKHLIVKIYFIKSQVSLLLLDSLKETFLTRNSPLYFNDEIHKY